MLVYGKCHVQTKKRRELLLALKRSEKGIFPARTNKAVGRDLPERTTLT
jgi:hypothetical protein